MCSVTADVEALSTYREQGFDALLLKPVTVGKLSELLADKLMQLVERQAREYGLRCVRTDTHKKNKPMQRLLRENGYRYRGNVQVRVGEGHDPARQGYEKILKERK